MTPAEISAAIQRYRVPLAAEAPGALAAVAPADLVVAYLAAKDALDGDPSEQNLETLRRSDIALRWATDHPLAPDHDPPPGWEERAWRAIWSEP